MESVQLKAYVDSDARVDRLRRTNRHRMVQAELSREEEELKRQQDHDKKIRVAQREASLAEVIAQQQTEDERQARMIQHVRETAPEIRDLESKLRAAYTNQERQRQIETAKAKKSEESRTERIEAQRIYEDAIKWQQQQIEASRAVGEKVKEVRETLEQQLAHKERLKQEAVEQYLAEKKQVDALVAKVEEQEYVEHLTKLEKQRVTKKQHDEFTVQREANKRSEKERFQAEERAIAHYMTEQNKRKESGERLKREKESAKAKVLEDQSRLIADERKKKEELEQLINDFYVESEAARIREHDQAERERKVRDRQAMLAANEHQMQLKKEKREAELAEEHKFRQAMMEKFADDDRIDQMNRQKRNEMKAEHARKVTSILEERRRLAELDRQREAELAALQKRREEERQELIDQERQRLLREHASKLQGFLPKGVLLSAEDVKLLQSQ